MKTKSLLFAFIVTLLTLVVACSDQQKQVDEPPMTPVEKEEQVKLQVYTTIYPLMDFTKKIGAEYVEVKGIIPVGADAHTFEPTAKTMVDVSNANLYIYNGAGIEGFADTTAEVLKTSDVKILMASVGIELISFNGHDDHAHKEDDDHAHEDDDDHGHEEDSHAHDDHTEGDPHIWLDPLRAIQIAENIKEALVELLPEAEEEFESNFVSLKNQLKALDEKFIAMVNEVPKKTIIVSHAGFGYWTERYGINQVGISGISPTNEPSIRQIQEVIQFAERNDLKYIMFEQNIPTKIAETVQKEVGADALWLHNLEALVQDDINNNEDYFSLMEKNIKSLKTALQ